MYEHAAPLNKDDVVSIRVKQGEGFKEDGGWKVVKKIENNITTQYVLLKTDEDGNVRSIEVPREQIVTPRKAKILSSEFQPGRSEPDKKKEVDAEPPPKPKPERPIKAERPKTRAEKFFEGIGADNLRDRIRLGLSHRIFRGYERQAQKLTGRVGGLEEEKRAFEMQLERVRREHEMLKTGRYGRVSAQEERKQQEEVRGLEEKIAAKKKEIIAERRELSVVAGRKSKYENGAKDLAEGLVEYVDRRLLPQERALEKIRERKDQLDNEIIAFKEVKERYEKDIVRLQREMEDWISPNAKSMIQAGVDKLIKDLEESEQDIASRIKERARIESEMLRLSEKAATLRARRDKYAVFTQKTVFDLRPEERPHEKIDTTRSIIGGERPALPEDDDWKMGDETLPGIEKLRNVKPLEYLKAWNKYFGSSALLKEKDLHIFGEKTDEEMPIDNLQAVLRRHLKAYDLHASDIDRKLERLIEFIAYENK
ncbi:MAG: hypothetical protein HYT34_01265 [Candidatus Ryanbacteria bacterium]|nr:hypothetical protein [Candidatus Ryanbacteria bacterium]